MTTRGLSWWRFVPPSGPVVSLLLVGLVLLSALLYYRAVKIQRFLEPALALSQPRNEFSKRIGELFRKEFGDQPVAGLKVRASSIQMQGRLIFGPDGSLRPEGRKVLGKLARMFLALLRDEAARTEVDRILIVSRFPRQTPAGGNVPPRLQESLRVGFIQDALFLEAPELGRNHASFFLSATGLLDAHMAADTVDFLIVPSEFLHIEVLERLEKYTH